MSNLLEKVPSVDSYCKTNPGSTLEEYYRALTAYKNSLCKVLQVTPDDLHKLGPGRASVLLNQVQQTQEVIDEYGSDLW